MKQSAGILLYQTQPLRFFLVHPGGPFWKKKDLGAWSIPKGEYLDIEDPLSAALREFREETGFALEMEDTYSELRPIKLKSGKTVRAWALKKYFDADAITSNTFEMEWPPRSGHRIRIPEVDKAAWLPLEDALLKINEAQRDLLLQVLDFPQT